MSPLIWSCRSFHTFPPRSVWWVWHRGGRAPLVPAQCLSALWHGHLHGAAGAAQHGDRVSKTRGVRAVWVMKMSFFQIHQPEETSAAKFPWLSSSVRATMHLSPWVCARSSQTCCCCSVFTVEGIKGHSWRIEGCQSLQRAAKHFISLQKSVSCVNRRPQQYRK